jgi:heme exporter protein D
MNMKRRKFLGIMGGASVVVSLASVLIHSVKSHAQQLSGALAERFRRMSQEAEARGLAEPPVV